MIRVRYVNRMTSLHTSITWTTKGLTPSDTNDENRNKNDKESSFLLLFRRLWPKGTVSGRWWFSGDGVFQCRGLVRRESLNTSIPTTVLLPLFLSFPSQHHTVPIAFILSITPICHDFICSLFSGFLTVKHSHKRRRALSGIMVSVYCRFHAPPHHEPIFPHIRACICICKHTYALRMSQCKPFSVLGVELQKV